jgi:hypothetical protein
MTTDRVIDLATGGAYLPPPGAGQPVQAAILALIGVWRLTGPSAGERRALLDRMRDAVG